MDERLQARLDRLHPTVKAFIERKDAEISSLQHTIAQLQGEVEPDPLAPSMVDYAGPFHERQLPVRTVSFPGPNGKRLRCSLDESGQGLLIHGDESLVVMPAASNQVYVKTERRI